MRSTKGEQTRAAIAEAALRMFREQGYEATTGFGPGSAERSETGLSPCSSEVKPGVHLPGRGTGAAGPPGSRDARQLGPAELG